MLDAVGRSLRLAPAEHAYLLALGGHAAAPVEDVRPATAAPAHLQRLLDGLATFPAFAVAADWGIAAWNAAYEALYPLIATVAEADRNLLWLLFTDPYVRGMLADWDRDSRHFLAEFRAEAGALLGPPPSRTWSPA